MYHKCSTLMFKFPWNIQQKSLPTTKRRILRWSPSAFVPGQKPAGSFSIWAAKLPIRRVRISVGDEIIFFYHHIIYESLINAASS